MSHRSACDRIASLVSAGSGRDRVLAAVADETVRLVGGSRALLVHLDDEVVDVLADTGAGASPDSRTDLDADVRRLVGGVRRGANAVRSGSSYGAGVQVEGRLWGLLVVAAPEPTVRDPEQALASFAGHMAAAIRNIEITEALRASRARVVAAADESRREIQRDLHDGAQQRLVQTVVELTLALGGPAAVDPDRAAVTRALAHAETALAQLRDLAQGILPVELDVGGLPLALGGLAAEAGVRVELQVEPRRWPAAVETTAYFVVAEALTNVVKHARAERVEIVVAQRSGQLVVEVGDDGSGGADPRRGSGLLGLTDRVSARSGTLTLQSGEGGTRVTARIPITGSGEPDVRLRRAG